MSFGKRRNLAGVALALSVMVLALAGCGGGGGSSTESSETTNSLTKAEFVKKGNAICAKTEKEVEEGVEKFTKEHNFSETKPPSEKQVAELAEGVLVPKVRKQLAEIRALGIPSGDEEEVEAIFAAAEEALRKTEEDPTAFGQGGVGPFVKANQLAREYGLTVCGAEPENEEGKGLEQGKGLGESKGLGE
jgi:hypothetical protein